MKFIMGVFQTDAANCSPAAAVPAKAKIPVPMIAPIPMQVRANGLLDADALRSRINAVAALCGRCCFACRQHASGNGGNRLSPYLDRQKNRAAIQRIIRSAEATFGCCRCNSEVLTRPIDGEIH